MKSTSDVNSEFSIFEKSVTADSNVLLVVGGGTAALTYLYTAELDPEISHVLVVGDRGYWNSAHHMLAQPLHMLALPDAQSEPFVDPDEHDRINHILPHAPESAYADSRDYQAKLSQLEKKVFLKLVKAGVKVYFEYQASLTKIKRDVGGDRRLSFELNHSYGGYVVSQVVIATGAGPARQLSPELQQYIVASLSPEDASLVMNEKIINYTDFLNSTSEKCRDKDVLIFGGGATAAWAMEVAESIAKPIAWVAKNGFDAALNAGPRVEAIIERTKEVQATGDICFVTMITLPGSVEKKLVIKVGDKTDPSSQTTHTVDYLINCIGQDPYGLGGLPEIIAPELKAELVIKLDKNDMTGTGDPCMLGWGSEKGDLMIIGAASYTYYDRNRPSIRPLAPSNFIPRSGQVPTTIGGVVSNVCALTQYMPLVQNIDDCSTSLLSMNVHLMNATQLAVYFTACYPDAHATVINAAVVDLIQQRATTYFGLAETNLLDFMTKHFAQFTLSDEAATLLNAGLMPTQERASAEVTTEYDEVMRVNGASTLATLPSLTLPAVDEDNERHGYFVPPLSV